VGSAEGFLFFRGAPEGINNENVDCYSLEVKTGEITKFCSKMEIFFNRKHALPYFRFPPLLSEPSTDLPYQGVSLLFVMFIWKNDCLFCFGIGLNLSSEVAAKLNYVV
jgi:hypothetical protein